MRRRRVPVAGGFGPAERQVQRPDQDRSRGRQTGTAEYGVGGGSTWDSRAEGEYEEVIAKARVLTERRPWFELYETMRFEPGAGMIHLDLHVARLRGLAPTSGSPSTRWLALGPRPNGAGPERPARPRQGDRGSARAPVSVRHRSAAATYRRRRAAVDVD